jgi:hypothetical protein
MVLLLLVHCSLTAWKPSSYWWISNVRSLVVCAQSSCLLQPACGRGCTRITYSEKLWYR